MLANVSLVDQLGVNANGVVDINANADCVSACVASGLDFLVGEHLGPGDPKDAAYSPQYVGSTDPTHYFAYMAEQGVTARLVTGSQDQLIATVISELQHGHPVLAAIPSKWGVYNWDTVGTNPTHEVLFCDYDGQNLTAMNPWPVDGHNAFYHTNPVSWWHDKIVYGHVCPMAKVATSMVTPVWNAQQGTLSYPAHDGLPAITLEHGQAFWANTNRAGLYPLAPNYYAGDNSEVVWSDGRKSVAVKAQNWAIHLEDAMPELALVLAAKLNPAPVSDASAPKLAALVAAVSQSISQLQTGLSASK